MCFTIELLYATVGAVAIWLAVLSVLLWRGSSASYSKAGQRSILKRAMCWLIVVTTTLPGSVIATSKPDTLSAARNVTICAQGACANSNITVQGSNISAANTTSLKADGQVNLLAAQNTAQGASQNTSSSSSLNIGANVGPQGAGITVGVSSNKANGNSSSSDTTWTNTQLTAGNKVSIQSGGDTTLNGAVVAGNTVKADVGGKLTIESLQDTSTYEQTQKSAGFSASVAVVGTGGGASANASKTNIDSTFQSVGQQSAIRAGDGGFQVNVKGETVLAGGVIASTQKAVDDGINSFTPGGKVTITDIENTASFDAKSVGGTIGTGSMLGSSSAGIGSKNDSASSTTQGGISGIAGNTAARTGDAETGLKPIFNASKVLNDVNAQVEITRAFGQQGAQAWGQYANRKFADAVKAEDAAAVECWGPTGACRAGGHAALGMLSGGPGAAAGAAVSSVTAPAVLDFLVTSGVPRPAAEALTQLTTGAAGAAVGGTAGAVGAVNEAGNNAVLAAPLIIESIVAGGVAAAQACMRVPRCVEVVGTTLLVAMLPAPAPGPNHTGNTDGLPDLGVGITATPNPGPTAGSTTTTPGTVVINPGTPPSGTGGPVAGDHTTVTPVGNGSPVGGTLVFNAPGHPPHDPSRDPTVGGYLGGTRESIDRINGILAGATDTTERGSVRNATQPTGASAERDFDYLSQGVSTSVTTPTGIRRFATLADGTRIVFRPGSSARSGNVPTIEVQRPDGKNVVEIRYERN